jgi:SET domain-containing protein
VGHKINHSAAPNVVYAFIAHPRFGRVRSVVAARDLNAGEELFSEYGRTVDGGIFLRQVVYNGNPDAFCAYV